MNALDVTIGQRYGSLQVIKDTGRYKSNYKIWECLCDCGNTKLAGAANLVRGFTHSCGCQTFHGPEPDPRKSTVEYKAWYHMIHRCTSPTSQAWHLYGGRGICVCQRWLDSFDNFLEDMGKRPYRHTLDRINNDGNYEPSNCRWATRAEQNRNKRSFAS